MSAETTNVAVVPREGDESRTQIAEEKPARKMISIWFFVGCLFTVYGFLILFAGLTSSNGREVAMSNLHAQIWWGIGLSIIGLAYVAIFRPRK